MKDALSSRACMFAIFLAGRSGRCIIDILPKLFVNGVTCLFASECFRTSTLLSRSLLPHQIFGGGGVMGW